MLTAVCIDMCTCGLSIQLRSLPVGRSSARPKVQTCMSDCIVACQLLADVPHTCLRSFTWGPSVVECKCLYAFSESSFKPKLLAQHHVDAWFAGLRIKVHVLSPRKLNTSGELFGALSELNMVVTVLPPLLPPTLPPVDAVC